MCKELRREGEECKNDWSCEGNLKCADIRSFCNTCPLTGTCRKRKDVAYVPSEINITSIYPTKSDEPDIETETDPADFSFPEICPETTTRQPSSNFLHIGLITGISIGAFGIIVVFFVSICSCNIALQK